MAGIPLAAGYPSADSLLDLSAHWDFRDPAGSEQRFRDLLGERASAAASERAQILSQLARAIGLQGRWEEAHLVLDRAQQLLSEETPTARARVLLERGRAHNGLPGGSDPEARDRARRARPFFLQSFELARDSGEEALALDAAHMMGIVEPPEQALRWSLDAIALAERSSDPRAGGWLGPLYNNTGWTYHDRGEYERALELFEKSVAFRTSRGEERELRIARWTVCRALRSLGRCEEALPTLRVLEREWEEAGEADGYLYEELAECHHALGRKSEARAYFARAHARLTEDAGLRAREPERLDRLRRLAE